MGTLAPRRDPPCDGITGTSRAGNSDNGLALGMEDRDLVSVITEDREALGARTARRRGSRGPHRPQRRAHGDRSGQAGLLPARRSRRRGRRPPKTSHASARKRMRASSAGRPCGSWTRGGTDDPDARARGEDGRHEVRKLLSNLKAALPSLQKMLADCSNHWGYEDPVYRFYPTASKSTGCRRRRRRLSPRCRPLLHTES